MPEIILRFQKIAKDADFNAPVPVTVHFGDHETEAFEFLNPINDQALSELRWYLEQYYAWPSDIDHQRARAVEGNLPKWGKALLDAVFRQSSEYSNDAMGLFRGFDQIREEGRIVTIATTEPRILRLPWELLRDEGGYLFSKNPAVGIRRRMHKTTGRKIDPFELPIRILLVSCRPEGAGFIDPRSIAAPLLDALADIPEQVTVEFLRPPTLTALDARLRDRAQPRVHLVHFDGHGVYDKGVGLGFLLFEDDECKQHMVDAEQIGTLLNDCGIPLMVLNACQSAQPDDRNPFASVAARLIESGVGGVVAMNYSVLVETAKRLTAHFYGALARGHTAAAALDAARRKLFADTKRGILRRPNDKEEILHLQDWFLPALYQQAEELRPFAPLSSPHLRQQDSGNTQAPAAQMGGVRGGFPPPPPLGFHGRARELLDIERAFRTRRVLVLHGFGGQGKTTLAAQAADWLTRTGLFQRAAFVSFESGVGLDYVLNELGNALVGDDFQIYAGDKIEALADALRQTPTLLVWDNFESVLPNGNAPLPTDELQKLLNAAERWLTPQSPITNNYSRLLLTSRNPDIPHAFFSPSLLCQRKELTGLTLSDAFDLAAAILDAHSLPRPPRVGLQELLLFLQCHPLSLQLALPHLTHPTTPEQLVARFKEILPSIKVGDAKERNESLEVSLRFSLDRLGPDAGRWLARLVVFEGGALESVLLAITEIPVADWNALKPQLAATALIRIEDLPGVRVPFIHFHPTLVPYLQGQNAEGSEPKVEVTDPHLPLTTYQLRITRFWQAYYALIEQLYQDDSHAPIPARSIVLRELPNLRRALRLCIAADALDEAVDFAGRINLFLDAFGRWRERDDVLKEVEKAVGSQQEAMGNITQAQFSLEIQRGERLLQMGRAAEAEKVFRALRARLEAGAAYDSRYDQMLVLNDIGRCLRAQGQPRAAAQAYQRALQLAGALEQTKNVKRQIGIIHTDLADALTDLGQYAEAKREYEATLEIMKEIGSDYGVTLGQLGMLALSQNDLSEARRRYLAALDTSRRMGEDRSEAIYLHQLGRVAQKARDWDEAERCYRQSLEIKERIGDMALVATTCNQLAIVAENAGRPAEAERWYLRTIEIDEKLGNSKDLASDYNNLANLYLSLNRLDEAETYARRAAAILETLDLSAQPWATYNILAKIAAKCERSAEAREWRRKEQETRLAFETHSQADTNDNDPGVRQRADQWGDVIAGVIAVCESGEQNAGLDQFLDEAGAKDDWRKLVAVIRQILNSERASTLFDDLNDVHSAIVRRILKGLAGSPAPNPQPQAEQGLTLPQLLELVERAAGGDRDLGMKLFPAMQQLASDPAQPAPVRALGGVLQRLLIGDRAPSLEGLSNELASAVRGMLARLSNNASPG